jgi:hypothetical protein
MCTSPVRTDFCWPEVIFRLRARSAARPSDSAMPPTQAGQGRHWRSGRKQRSRAQFRWYRARRLGSDRLRARTLRPGWHRIVRSQTGRQTATGRALLECRPIQITDAQADAEYSFSEALLEAARASREAVRGRLAASLARLNAPDPETFQADASLGHAATLRFPSLLIGRAGCRRPALR